MAELTGYNKDEVLGHSLVEDIITEESRALVKEVQDLAMKGVGTTNF